MRRLAPLALVFAFALPAAAQTPTASSDDGPMPAAGSKSVIDFTEVHVIGALERPSGEVVWGKPKIKFRNLIELRGNFRRELARSASKLP